MYPSAAKNAVVRLSGVNHTKTLGDAIFVINHQWCNPAIFWNFTDRGFYKARIWLIHGLELQASQ